jgi:hypothetical protein
VSCRPPLVAGTRLSMEPRASYPAKQCVASGKSSAMGAFHSVGVGSDLMRATVRVPPGGITQPGRGVSGSSLGTRLMREETRRTDGNWHGEVV